MKTLILTALIVLTHSQAFAGTTQYKCGKPGQGAYSVVVDLVYPAGSEGSKAKLYIEGSAKPVKMTCAIPAIEPGRMGTDRPYPIASCNDGIRDGGYSVSLSGGGFVGIPMASVRAKSIAGTKTVASLLCNATN